MVISSRIFKQAFFSCLLLSIAGTAMAQSQATSTMVASATTIKKVFALNASLGYSSNMYAEDQYDKSSSTSLFLAPSARFTDKTTLAVRTTFIKEHTQAENLLMTNTTVRLSHKTAAITPSLAWGNRLDGILPTNRDSQLIDRLQAAMAIGTSLSYNNKNTILPFTLMGLLSIQRNFHEYDINADGAKNNAYGITQGLALNLELTDKMGLSIAGNYKTAINYDNNSKYGFDTSIDLSYSLTENFGLSAGVSNGGSALKANGIDSNISFIDKKSSELNIAMNVTY